MDERGQQSRSTPPGEADEGERAPLPEVGEHESALLTEAIRLARENATAGELPFGALVVVDGEVVGTGVNTALRDGDPTAHAEVAAVRAACRSVGLLHLTGGTVVSSCEPCAVCHAVAASVGVTRIVYAAPKEVIPELGYPAPDDNAELVERMQQALRATAPGQVVHVPTDGAKEPFRHYLDVKEQHL